MVNECNAMFQQHGISMDDSFRGCSYGIDIVWVKTSDFVES